MINIHASDIVTGMPFFEKNSFLSVCREFYLAAAKQVKRRLPLSCFVLSTLRFLCPERGKEHSSRDIADLARRFPNIVPPENITELQREWQRYQTNNIVGSPHDTVDYHWHALSKMKDASGCQEFPLLSRFTSGMLVIPHHASADIERNFSKMGYDKTKTRNSVGTSLLNSLMTIGCNRGHMTCLTFKPTSLMRQELPQHVAKAAGRFKGTESTCTAKGTSDGGNPEGSTNRSVVVSQSSTLTRPNPWPLHDNFTGPDIKSQINCRSSHVLKHAAFSCKRPSTTTIHSQPVSKASKVRAATSKGDVTKADRANAFEFLQSIVNNQNPKEILIWGSEYLLAPSLCQFRIDGRDGSNACTVIAAQVCRQILLQENSLSLPPESSYLEDTLVQAMTAGNNWYDQMCLKGFLSTYDVVNMEPSLGLIISEDYFVRPGQWQGLVDFICSRQLSSSVNKLVTGVLVVSTYSFAVCFLEECALFLVFDSHSHGTSGGLIATVAKDHTAEYFEEFVSRHYGFLCFVPSRKKVAQLTILTLCS